MDIRRIEKSDYDQFCKIEQSAYAASFKGTPDELLILDTIFKDLTDNGIQAIGAYENDLLIGCVLYYEFETNFHQNMIKTAGIGSLAVDLLHKKKGVAKALIQYSLQLAKNAGIELYHLYPFSTKFYRNFGFGYGPPMYTYCIKPEDFMALGDKSILRYASPSDYQNLFDLHDSMASITHGMSLKSYGDKRKLERMDNGKVVLAEDNGRLIGYIVYRQSGLNPNNNQSQQLDVIEMVYENTTALKAFSSFFNSQKDQVDFIKLSTHDNSIQHITSNTCFAPEPKTLDIISLKVADKAMGLMPLVLSPQKLLDKLDFHLNYTLEFDLRYPRGESQKVSIGEGTKLAFKLSINDFSSWITGVISLSKLYELALLETKDRDKLKKIDQSFYFDSPKSLVRF